MAPYIGTPTSRVDGHAKVTGAAKYAGEFNVPGLAYGAVVTSTIAKGRIARIDVSEALRVVGVLDVLTHDNRPRMAATSAAYKDDVAPEKGSPFRPLYDDKILFSGQPIALVLAEEWEIARFAASLVRVEYKKQAHSTDLFARRDRAFVAETPERPRGKADRTYAAAAVRHEAEYYIPIEHHNPMELYASTVMWDGDGKLTVYDKTQGVQNVQHYLCGVFKMKLDDVRVVSPFVGGAFGSGLRPQYQVVLAVLGARALERSVRLVLTRQQMYGLGYRPATIERLAIGAKADGTLDAISHEAIAATSQYEDFSRNDTGWSGQLYKSANAKYQHKLVRLDLATPVGHARAGRGDRRLCARMRDGRTGGGAQARSAGAALALLLGPRPARGRSLYQQELARMLPPGRGRVRLEQAQRRAALDARRQRAGRLGHGDGHLGGAADGMRRPHRADGQRPRRGRIRVLRHRHRHLHDHGAGGRRHARSAARQCHRQARQFDAAASARRGRLMDGGLGIARDRQNRRRRCARSYCGWPRPCRIRRSQGRS